MRRYLAGPVVVAVIVLSMHAAQALAQPGESDAPPDQPQSQPDEAERRDGEAQPDNADPGARGFGRRDGRGPGGPRFFGGPRQEERGDGQDASRRDCGRLVPQLGDRNV